ncbi:protein kinase, putative, partial [Plasmodium reichenowi]
MKNSKHQNKVEYNLNNISKQLDKRKIYMRYFKKGIKDKIENMGNLKVSRDMKKKKKSDLIKNKEGGLLYECSNKYIYNEDGKEKLKMDDSKNYKDNMCDNMKKKIEIVNIIPTSDTRQNYNETNEN